MQTFTGATAIHAPTWSAARPAARRVRRLAALATVAAAGAGQQIALAAVTNLGAAGPEPGG